MQWLNSAIRKKMTPSRRKLKAKGETSTLQTGKYNIMQTIYQSSQLNDKNASRELKNVFFSRFQLYTKVYVHDTYTSGASEKFFKVMNLKKQCWTPNWDRIILIQQFLKEKSLQTMICTCSSIIPLKTVGKIINLKVFLFWLCYKTDGKWLQYPLNWVMVTLRRTIA